ncbi:MAG: hypothetical protein M0Z88_00365 [Actinomycetota bacterium]|nr:hypothetical protein [Actinomycetota bacterium]
MTNQQLRLRRIEQVDDDAAHAIKVKKRRNAYEAERMRRLRRVEASQQGRSVRAYHRKSQGDEETPD